MKTLKSLSVLAFLALIFSACSTQVIYEDDVVVVNDPIPDPVPLSAVLNSHELWYVDINRTTGNGEIPFLQKAFTVSFLNGTLWANNNLVGIGSQGNGFGLDVGFYDVLDYDYILEVNHDLDGFYPLEITPLSHNEIRVYYRPANISYVLVGYQRNTFDYDLVFYDNIHYFLQEYVAWEKTMTSSYGDANPFDKENFLQFLPAGGLDNFRSSKEPVGTNIDFIFWDYEGVYNVADDASDPYIKYLTLDYDYLGNEYFELHVINDSTIELYHPQSGTLYRYKGRGYIQYKRAEVKRQSKADIQAQIKELVKT